MDSGFSPKEVFQALLKGFPDLPQTQYWEDLISRVVFGVWSTGNPTVSQFPCFQGLLHRVLVQCFSAVLLRVWGVEVVAVTTDCEQGDFRLFEVRTSK